MAVASISSGVTCYRAQCNGSAGAYSSKPNENFFETEGKKPTSETFTCYRGTACNSYAYNSTQYSSLKTYYFNFVESKASGLTCYRASSCNDLKEDDSCLFTNAQTAVSTRFLGASSDTNCTYASATGCKYGNPNTNYFITSSISGGSGISCKYASAVNTANGYCESSPAIANTLYFKSTSVATSATLPNCDRDKNRAYWITCAGTAYTEDKIIEVLKALK